MTDIKKFEKFAKKAFQRAQKENEIYDKHLIPFAKKIGLHKCSKTIEEAAKKAVLWDQEKQKYGINDYFCLPKI